MDVQVSTVLMLLEALFYKGLTAKYPGSIQCVKLEWDRTGVGYGSRTSEKKDKLKAKASHGEF